MSRNLEQMKIKNELDIELEKYSFKGYENVARRTHPKSFSDRFCIWWNKEVTVPLVPVGMVAVILLSTTIGSVILSPEPVDINQGQLVEVGGNIYRTDLLEKGGEK